MILLHSAILRPGRKSISRLLKVNPVIIQMSFKVYFAPPLNFPEASSGSGVDFTLLPVLASAATDDELLIYDVSEATNKKILVENLTFSLSSLLASIDTIGVVAGDMIYGASSTNFTKVATQTYGRSLLGASSILSGRSLLGLTLGTDVQAQNTTLQSLADIGASSTANDLFYYVDSTTMANITLTAYTRDTLLTIANAAALATNIGALTLSGSAVDNRMVKFDGTGGAIQGTGISIDDSDNMTSVNDITITGSINSVSAAMLAEYANLGAATVDATQWGYVGGADQQVATTDNVTFNSVVSTTTVNAAGGSMTGAVNMNSNKITNLGAPTLAGDAATKTYVDSVAGGAHASRSGGCCHNHGSDRLHWKHDRIRRWPPNDRRCHSLGNRTRCCQGPVDNLAEWSILSYEFNHTDEGVRIRYGRRCY